MIKSPSLIKALILVSFMVVLLTSMALAQSDTPLTQVEVDLWPEFDRPTMLTIYRITLSPQMVLPFEMNFRIPAEAGIPNAVAARQPDGSLINIPFNLEESEDWSTLVFQATTPELQIEYYHPGLEKDGATRRFEYTWAGDYAVDNFVVEVQQPAGAEDMHIKPGMVRSRQGSDGLAYHTLDVGALPVGQPFTIDLEYQKANDQLSSMDIPLEPSGPISDSASGRMNFASGLPIALGLIGVLLIVGGGLWYWQSGREAGTPKRKRGARRKPASRDGGAGMAEGGNVYCHQCGKRAAPGDRFCRACGTQLRISG